MCYQALGDARLLEPMRRGMNAFLVMQQRRAAGGLGAAIHARHEARRGANLRAEGAGDAHDRSQHRPAARVLPADRRHEVPRSSPGGHRLARRPDASGGCRATRTHASHLHRAGHEQATLRAPRGIERLQRPLLRRWQPEEHDRPLQLVPPHRPRRPEEAVRRKPRRCLPQRSRRTRRSRQGPPRNRFPASSPRPPTPVPRRPWSRSWRR